MGAIRERKVVCEKAKTVPSNPESDVNSRHTSQDASEDESQFNAGRSEPHRPHHQGDALNIVFHRLITRNTGKRQARRILNNRYLEMLNEESEEFEEDCPKSKFQLLMEETDDALELLKAYDHERDEMNTAVISTALGKYEGDGLLLRDPYFLIPRKIRTAIDNRKNFQYELLKSLEMLITNQLMRITTGEFIHKPHTCYERLLMHAIAKFKGLQSETIIDGDNKLVKIILCEPSDHTKTSFLCDYINTIRLKAQ